MSVLYETYDMYKSFEEILTLLNTPLPWGWGLYSCFDWLIIFMDISVYPHWSVDHSYGTITHFQSKNLAEPGYFVYFSTCQQIPRKRPKDQFILLTSIVCVTKAGYSPVEQNSIVVKKTIKNTSVSHAVGLGDKFRHRHEHEHCNLFWVDPTYSVMVLEILTRVQNVEIGPQLIVLSLPVWFKFDKKLRYPAVSGKLQSPWRDLPLQNLLKIKDVGKTPDLTFFRL